MSEVLRLPMTQGPCSYSFFTESCC